MRIFLIVAAIALSLAALACFVGLSGTVSGVEFSPDRFSHRSFRYYQFCGLQITPKQTREWRSHVDDYLHKHGFVSNGNSQNPRWHFVKGFAPGVRGWSGMAKYMCQSVGCWNGDDKWIKWSNERPDLAEVIWPQVVTWARNGQYDEIVTLFRLTELDLAKTPRDAREKIELAKVIAQE